MSTNTRGINLSDLRYSISQTRSNFTRLRGHSRRLDPDEQQADFITLIYLVYEIYRLSGDQLAPIQQFHPSREQQYNQGHTSTISHIEFPRNDASTVQGKGIGPPEHLIVKRPRQSILEPQSSALVSFITELRIRTHEPLRAHQSIAKFRGVGWDFEDEEATIPRPLLLEELAPQGSLDHFWVKWSFITLAFKSKLDLCRDIAEGLLALHRCGVVHGDVKPDNVLVFPRQDVNNSFKAKLTDFGHSVFEHSRLNTVPAFTPLWCAPEVETAAKMSFNEMKATDSYSYGLVVLSIMVARVFHTEIQDVKEHKQNDTLLREAINLIEKEDRENNNSDFDIGIIRSLLERTVRLEPKYRSLQRCVAVMKNYDMIHGHENGRAREFAGYRFEKIPPLKVDEMIAIGYQSLRRCSYQLKAYITTKLTAIAANGEDPRRMAAAWELAVCHFSGFGVSISFTESSMWLSMAMKGGIAAANSFYYVLHQAMDIPVDPSYVNVMFPTANTQKGATTLFREKRAPFKENQELQVLEMSNGEEEDGPSDNDFEGRNTPDKPFRLLNDVSDIIREGSVEELEKHLRDEPALLNGRDFQGNSPLLLAAKSKRKDMLEVLISYDDLDASISDDSGRTVLHFLTEFDEATAQTWVRQLYKRKGDVHHEALPSRGESETLSFMSGIRCCSILNAILHGKLGLLQALLDACHTPENAAPCRICEGGSAFRRIIAICLSIFRADAAQLLVAHRETHGALIKIDLTQIEAWAGHDLLPLYTIPFNSIAVKAMDFPESLFRAINFGDQYNRMLEQTLKFLIPTEDDIEEECYLMLQQVVRSDCIHAAQILIRLGEQRGFSKQWWIKEPIDESPFMESIRIGSRELFDLFCNESPDILSGLVAMPCERHSCKLLRPPFYNWWTSALLGRPNEWRDFPHTHNRNLVQIALHTFSRASHADMYFLDAILKRTQKDLVVNSAAGFMVDSVLSSDFLLAASLSDYAPELWLQNPWDYSHTLTNLGLYAKRYGINSIFMENHSNSVASAILAVGSYDQCRFMMKRLLPLRGSGLFTRSHLQWMKAKEHSIENAVPNWTQCKLSETEFFHLVEGNIVRAWPDRDLLWAVIQEQIAQGHSASMSDLVRSIRHGNSEALGRMISGEWNAKALISTYFQNPLLEIQRLRNRGRPDLQYYEQFRNLLQILYPGLPQSEWMGSATHAIVYDQYKKEQDEQGRAEWFARLQKCEDILFNHGIELPSLVTAWQRARNTAIAWVSVLYISLYAVVLPLVLVFGTRSTWTGWSSGEKFIFAYLWSAVAAAAPPPMWLCIRNHNSRLEHKRIWSWSRYGRQPGKYRADLAYFWIVSFLIDHVVVLVLVIRVGWRPFQTCNHMLESGITTTTCTNYSYLLPLAVGAVELVISFVIVGIRQVYFDL